MLLLSLIKVRIANPRVVLICSPTFLCKSDGSGKVFQNILLISEHTEMKKSAEYAVLLLTFVFLWY